MQAGGNATALRITPRSVVVTANDASKVYGAAMPALPYAVDAGDADTGLVNGDTLSGSLASDGKASSNVGQYAIGQGSLGNANYSLLFNGATLDVTPASLRIVYNATTTTSIYGNPVEVSGVAVADGLVNGDTLSGVTSGTASFGTSATALSDVGRYGVTGTGLSASSANYTVIFAQASGNATALTITPRPATITADPQQRALLTGNPALTYTIGGLGLVNGDRLTGGLSTTAQPFSPTGRYPITQGSLAASSNYDLTYVGADLTIASPPMQSLSDFLGWLRQSIVRFEPRAEECGAPSFSAKPRQRGRLILTRSACAS